MANVTIAEHTNYVMRKKLIGEFDRRWSHNDFYLIGISLKLISAPLEFPHK